MKCILCGALFGQAVEDLDAQAVEDAPLCRACVDDVGPSPDCEVCGGDGADAETLRCAACADAVDGMEGQDG